MVETDDRTNTLKVSSCLVYIPLYTPTNNILGGDCRSRDLCTGEELFHSENIRAGWHIESKVSFEIRSVIRKIIMYIYICIIFVSVLYFVYKLLLIKYNTDCLYYNNIYIYIYIYIIYIYILNVYYIYIYIYINIIIIVNAY